MNLCSPDHHVVAGLEKLETVEKLELQRQASDNRRISALHAAGFQGLHGVCSGSVGLGHDVGRTSRFVFP